METNPNNLFEFNKNNINFPKKTCVNIAFITHSGFIAFKQGSWCQITGSESNLTELIYKMSVDEGVTFYSLSNAYINTDCSKEFSFLETKTRTVSLTTQIILDNLSDSDIKTILDKGNWVQLSAGRYINLESPIAFMQPNEDLISYTLTFTGGSFIVLTEDDLSKITQNHTTV